MYIKKTNTVINRTRNSCVQVETCSLLNVKSLLHSVNELDKQYITNSKVPFNPMVHSYTVQYTQMTLNDEYTEFVYIELVSHVTSFAFTLATVIQVCFKLMNGV